MFCHHIIDKKTADYLRPKTPHRSPLFYGLPKIHKFNIPIVSGCDGPTDKLSQFIAHFIQPFAESLPSYFKDTTHFLRLLQSQKFPSNNCILVTADVTSLYTNIQHREGIDAVRFFMERTPLDKRPKNCPPIAFIDIILETILTHSTFQFSHDFFHQISGASMGTRMAPPYANLFMGKLDAAITGKFPNKITFYKRFIDDIFFAFHGPLEELNEVFQFMNSMHPTIKFTFNQSVSSINFMDLTIYKNNNGDYHTTIHRKLTDTMSLLHYDSNHPSHLKSSLIYSQALRNNRIFLGNKCLAKELQTLAKILVVREYPLNIINKHVRKALRWTQRELIEKPKRIKKDNIVPLIITHSKIGKRVSQIVRKYWHLVEEDHNLRKLWPSPPTTTYRNTYSLRDSLVHTKFEKI